MMPSRPSGLSPGRDGKVTAIPKPGHQREHPSASPVNAILPSDSWSGRSAAGVASRISMSSENEVARGKEAMTGARHVQLVRARS
jgi:hypothetical protein